MIRVRFGKAVFTCSDRTGGISHGRYASLNVGDHVGDDEHAVQHNRAVLARVCNVNEILFARQVHSASVISVGSRGIERDFVGDAFVLGHERVGVAMMTADCMPIGIAPESGVALAVVHAGWRGLADGVLEATISTLWSIPGIGDPSTWDVFIGPCARAETYEFGAEDLAIVADRCGDSVRSRTPTGALSVDLVAGARTVLGRFGIDRIADCGVNTMVDDRYFSHRRSGSTGRQAIVGAFESGAPA